MVDYICRGEDHEDLTEKVLKAKNNSGIVTATFCIPGSNEPRGKRKWRVVVFCSQGHRNIFKGED